MQIWDMSNASLIEQSEDELGDFDHWGDSRAIKAETYRELLSRFKRLVQLRKADIVDKKSGDSEWYGS